MADAQVVLLEAPGGYGKTTAARLLAAALDRPLVRAVLPERADVPGLLSALIHAARRAGLPGIAEAIDVEDGEGSLRRLIARLDGGDGAIVAVDEVQRAAPAVAGWIAELAAQVPAGARLLVAGRRVPTAVRALVDTVDAVHLGAAELRLDGDEVTRLLVAAGLDPDGAEAAAPSMLAMTDGWPAAVALAGSLGDRSDGAAAPDTRGPRQVLHRLVDELLDAATHEERRTIEQLVGVPLLSGRVAELVGGPGSLDRLRDLGLPLRYRTDGWAELPDPVKELIPSRALPPETARAVARSYAERGALPEATALLRALGDHQAIAGLLVAAEREALVTAGIATIGAIASELPDPVLATVPTLVVELVRAAERRGRMRTDWVERALRLLPDPSPARRAVDAERSLDMARAGDLEGGAALAEAVITAAGSGETATLGRAHYIRGLLRLVADPASASAAAAAQVEVAVGLLQAAGERAWEADAWQVLGLGCHAVVGRFEAGVACLERAVALRSARDPVRAATLTYLAELQVHRGDLDAAAVAVREAAAIGRRLGDARSIAYAAWSGARLAAERRDIGGVRAALATAEANPEGWFDQLAGIEFLADGADMLAVSGAVAEARRWIERVKERGREVDRGDAALVAEARVALAAGDPASVLALVDRMEASVLAVPRDRWLAWLLRAAALRDLGRDEDAASWLAAARQAVADQDDPGRLDRREPELLARLAPGLDGAPEVAPTPTTDLAVILLGRFAVERGGQDASPPPGRPATLVKLIALRGTITLDEAVEALWEDVDEEVGRARLRNVLNRVRSASGEVVVRREEALALGPGVIVDAARFEQEAAAALRAPAAARVGLARAALTRATGELLPGDRYADWASTPRERITRRHLALLDLVADDAIARGDLDEAGRLLDEAIALDPLEEERHVRLGRALLRQGRTAAARRVADRAVTLCEELDVEPGDDLARLLQELARQT
jgi:DNA-binding SARP family transcriptional activator/ATP/maltotriose-dependent transcriptional regulator MalT